jgi:ribosomal-protein-alanine N-acetyltransferase
MGKEVSNNETIKLTPISISSERILLEPVSLVGLDDFHEYSVYPELYRYLEFSPFQSLKESEAYLQKLIDRSETPFAQYFFIKLNKNDKIIGSFGMHSLDTYRKSVEIGYGISPYYWGQGYFSETLKLAMEYIFNDLCLHRVVARTAILNTASIKGLEKLGFLKEGVMRDYYRGVDGKWFDAVLMAKLNKDSG